MAKNIISLIVLLSVLATFLLRPLNFFAADLGRHLQNGKLLSSAFLNNQDVLFRNLYSFTHSDFPFLNHHWGSGVVFHWISQAGGFEALSIFYFVLVAGAFVVMLYVSRKQAAFPAVLAAAILALPLIGYRTEVRPEGFSDLFIAIFVLILSRRKGLAWIPGLMLFWVNLHIQFILGAYLLGAYLIESFFIKDRKHLRSMLWVSLACVLCGMITPLGYHLLLFPLQIFENYGYRIVENQSLWFYLTHDFKIPVFGPACLFFSVLAASMLTLLWKKPDFGPKNAQFWVGLGALALGFSAIRNLAIMALLGMPLIAQAFDFVFNEFRSLRFRKIAWIALILPGLWACGSYAYLTQVAWPPHFALGLPEESNQAAAFIKLNGIRGPIFNNYDIGGYLIYHLYPNEKVFVDNRPEAYPAEFFEKLYVPMQEDPTVWREALKRYDFNTIVFYRLDLTPWAQKFLIERVQDPEWAPVFVDMATIIFLRRNNQNAELIRKYEIAKSRFRVSG